MAQLRGRVASPKAKRITFTGILAETDKFHRLHVTIMSRNTNDTFNATAQTILAATEGARVRPYELYSTDDTGASGVITINIPQAHKEYWLGVAEQLRSQWVSVEVTIRPYRLHHQSGVSFDLEMKDKDN